MEDEQRHKDLIANLKARGACGIAIQPGYYIKEIPGYILKEADRLQFPVIELPKELTFSHIMHVLLDFIRSHEDAKFSPNKAALLKRLYQWEKSAPAIEKSRASDSERLLIWAVPSRLSQGAAEEKLRKAVNRIKQCLKPKCSRVFTHVEERGAFLFAQGMDTGFFQFLMMDIGVLFNNFSLNETLNILAGASSLKPGQSLEDGLDKALKAVETLERTGARRGVCPYNNIGLFEMLAPVIKSRPADYAPGYPLKELLSYDKAHNTALVQTLRAYLLCPDNLCAGAQMLYIHRHTFKNRLEKIEQLLALSLNNHYIRLQLSLELLMYDLF
jgi:hypothetical protein